MGFDPESMEGYESCADGAVTGSEAVGEREESER